MDKLSQFVKATTECRNLRLETIFPPCRRLESGGISVAPGDQVARPISRFAYKSPRIADEASKLMLAPDDRTAPCPLAYRFESRSESIRFSGAPEAPAESRINRSTHSFVPPQVVLHVDFLYAFLDRSMSMWMLSWLSEYYALCSLPCNPVPTWRLRLNA